MKTFPIAEVAHPCARAARAVVHLTDSGAKRLAAITVAAGLAGGWAGPVAAVTVDATQGIRLQQVDFRLRTSTVARSSTGLVEIDTIRLRQTTGLSSGYLNVSTSRGWVLRNVPIPEEASFPYGKVLAKFNLGVSTGTAVSTLAAAIDYSPTLLSSFNGTRSTQAVTPRTLSPTGGSVGGGAPPDRTPDPPDFEDIVFGGGPGPGDEFWVQWDHPNIEAANNQCVPMSVANSLQFLKVTAGLPVPHEHKPGLKPSVAKGDTSLVGQIEEAMGRQVTDRDTGSFTDFGDGLAGKLKYLAQAGLAGRVEVTHWTLKPDRDRSSTVGTATAKSTYKGKVDLAALMQATKGGQNCEIDVADPEGQNGHAVELVAMGRHQGNWWIKHASDQVQFDDTEGAGPDGVLFDYLTSEANGTVSLSNGHNIHMIICEKALPPPSTALILELTDPGGHLCCVNPPPGTLTVERDGAAITFRGSGASWLPLTGTINVDGSFEALSTTTVAGRSNVRTRFAGTFANGRYDGTLSVGTRGELNGVPISWRLQVVDPAAGTLPAMRVNGFRNDVAIRARDAVKPTISMRAGAQAGKPVDWWVVGQSADGQTFWYDLATHAWKPGLAATYTGPLMDVPYFGLPSFDGLPAGSYAFYFGFDTAPNGQLDISLATYERTVLTIRP